MIYHFNLAYLDGMSGGDRCTLELIRHFAARGIENTLLTTERGRARFVAEGLEESRLCRYLVIPDFDPGAGGLSILTAYIRRLRPAFRLVDELSLEDGDLIYCHNEFFPNLLPCNRLAARSPEIRLIYHLHMLAPDLWRGYQGQFTGEFHWPSLRLINYRIQQYIFRKTVPERALVVYNNAYYDQTISKWFPANKRYNIERYSGVDLAETPAVGKSYDLVWCGRFHAQKGVDKIPEMVGLLKERKPDISLAVIGSGAPWEERLRRDIERRGLQRNIELKGFLEGPEKFAVFKSAHIPDDQPLRKLRSGHTRSNEVRPASRRLRSAGVRGLQGRHG